MGCLPASVRQLVFHSLGGVPRLQIMRDQDESLEDLSKTARSTKQIALAINDELDLHVSHQPNPAATRRLRTRGSPSRRG